MKINYKLREGETFTQFAENILENDGSTTIRLKSTYKRCSQCRYIKDKTMDFHRNFTQSDFTQSMCKACSSEYGYGYRKWRKQEDFIDSIQNIDDHKEFSYIFSQYANSLVS